MQSAAKTFGEAQDSPHGHRNMGRNVTCSVHPYCRSMANAMIALEAAWRVAALIEEHQQFGHIGVMYMEASERAERAAIIRETGMFLCQVGAEVMIGNILAQETLEFATLLCKWSSSIATEVMKIVPMEGLCRSRITMELQNAVESMVMVHHQAQREHLVSQEKGARDEIAWSRQGDQQVAIKHLLKMMDVVADESPIILMQHFTQALQVVAQQCTMEKSHMMLEFKAAFLSRLESANYHWSVIAAPQLHLKKLNFLQRVTAVVQQIDGTSFLMSKEMDYLSRSLAYGGTHSFVDFFDRVSSRKNHRQHNICPHYLFANTQCYWSNCRATHPDADWGVRL